MRFQSRNGTLRSVALAVVCFSCLVPRSLHAEDVTIILAAGFTSTGGGGGESVAGATEAVRDINEAGGLLGRQVRLVLQDDAATPEIAAALARKVVLSRPALVVGDDASDYLMATSPIYAAAGIVQISAGATSPQVTEQGFATLFRLDGRDDRQGAVAGNFMADHWKGRRIAILHDGGIYGKGLADYVLETLHKRGLHEALVLPFESNGVDYSHIIATLQKARVERIYLSAYVNNSGTLVRQMRLHGFKATVLGGDTFQTTDYTEFAGPYSDGTIFTASPNPGLVPANAQLVARIKPAGARPRVVAGGFGAYAAVQLWAQAVKKANSFEGASVANILHTENFDTVLGQVGFDAKGDVVGERGDWNLYIWKGGQHQSWNP